MHRNTLQHAATNCNTLQYTEAYPRDDLCRVDVRYTLQRTVQHIACSTLQHSTLQHSTLQHSTLQHSTLQHYTLQFNTLQCTEPDPRDDLGSVDVHDTLEDTATPCNMLQHTATYAHTRHK